MSNSVDAEAGVIGQAMSDANFRRKLLADPVRTLKDAGVEVPEGVAVRVLEDTATLVHVVLPAPVDKSEIADTDLDTVAGGCPTSKRQTAGGGGVDIDRKMF